MFCEKECDWDKPTTLAATNTRKQKCVAKSTTSHGKHAIPVENSKSSASNDENDIIYDKIYVMQYFMNLKVAIKFCRFEYNVLQTSRAKLKPSVKSHALGYEYCQIYDHLCIGSIL